MALMEFSLLSTVEQTQVLTYLFGKRLCNEFDGLSSYAHAYIQSFPSETIAIRAALENLLGITFNLETAKTVNTPTGPRTSFLKRLDDSSTSRSPLALRGFLRTAGFSTLRGRKKNETLHQNGNTIAVITDRGHGAYRNTLVEVIFDGGTN